MKGAASVFTAAVLLCACVGPETLGGSYELTEAGGHSWVSNGRRIVVDDSVVAHQRIGRHLLVRRKVARSVDCYDAKGVPKILTRFSNVDEYWVIDVKDEKERGPLNEDSFVAALRELGLTSRSVKLDPQRPYMPNDVAFDAEVQQLCARVDAI